MTAQPLESSHFFTPVSAFDAEEARLGKIVAEKVRRRFDDEFFHATPRFMVDHTDEQKLASRERRKAEKKEASARSFDADACLINGCPIWELNSPRSILGQEAKRLHQEKLAADEARRKTDARREKRRLDQRDRRQRVAAAKKPTAAEA